MTAAVEAFDVVVLGAGAAGLMCALTAGQRGRKVLLLDHADQVGAKILISGGGRCNFTNSAQPRRIAFSPPTSHFCRSALGRYTQDRLHRAGRASRHCLITKRRWANCSATARRAPSSPCCWPNARKAVSMSGSVIRITDVSRADGFRSGHEPWTLSPRRRSCWRRAACRSRKWVRPVFPMTWRAASACA